MNRSDLIEEIKKLEDMIVLHSSDIFMSSQYDAKKKKLVELLNKMK